MKQKIYLLALVLVIGLAFAVGAQEPASKGSEVISTFAYPDLKWSVPEIGREVQREVLPNGLTIYLMEDHRLPLFNVTALIHCGDAYLPIEKMAIPELAGTVMRTGGTTSIAADSLNALLEMIGGTLELNVGYDNGTATLDIMAKDLELGLRLMADVLRNPAFPEDKLDLAKEQKKTDIKRRNDSPAPILSREFNHLIYGDHPSGRILEWQYVKPISRQDLADFHQAYFAPNNIMLGITGDFDPTRIKELVTKYFGDWPKKAITLPEISKVTAAPKPGVYEFYKDISQANLRIGHLGISRDNPDRYAVAVMNYILGGGSFTSRLTTKVRSDEGLAYNVGSTFQSDSRDLGTFFAYVQTKLETTHKAIRLMLNEIERIRTSPVGDEELKNAKDGYINRFVFNFTTPQEVVDQLMRIEFNNRPPDLLKKYIDNIRAVTKEDVQRVAQKYLKPEDLSFVIVGKPEGFEKPLDEFGPVIKMDVKEPVVE